MASVTMSYFLRVIWIGCFPFIFLMYFWHQSSDEAKPIGYAVLALIAFTHDASKAIKSYVSRNKKRTIGFALLTLLTCFYAVIFYTSRDSMLRSGIFYATALSSVFAEFYLDKYHPLSDDSPEKH